MRWSIDQSSMEAGPFDKTKRSRLGQMGSSGSKRITRFQIAKISGASAMGVPGCPDFACWTASIERVRIVLIASWSRSSLVMPLNSRFLHPCFGQLGFGRLLAMPAELVAHGREQLVREIRLAPGAEPLVEGRRQHMGRHAFVDRGLDGPPAFAGVGHPAREFRQAGVLDQGRRREIEQPGSD